MKRYLFLHFLFVSSFFIQSLLHADEVINKEMSVFQKTLEEKCKDNTAHPFTKDLFPTLKDYEHFTKGLEDLFVTVPANTCDFLKHPQVFSAISVLPQLEYDSKDKEHADILKRVEIEFSRKFFVSKILELKEKFVTFEKESIDKKQALNSEEFYLKGLVACLDVKCPDEILHIILEKIPKSSKHMVYGKNIKEIYLDDHDLENFLKLEKLFKDEIDLTYNKSELIKESYNKNISQELKEMISNYGERSYFAVLNPNDFKKSLHSHEEINSDRIVLSELTGNDHQGSRNVIGFALPTSSLIQVYIDGRERNEEILNAINSLEDRYKTSKIRFAHPDWKSEIAHPGLDNDDDLRKTEIDYEVKYFNVYGAVNNEKGQWFLVRDRANKSFWIHQSQFYNSVSISKLLLSSNLENNVQFYESPEGTKAKKTSADVNIKGFTAKLFKWNGDQLWILIDTDEDELCGATEEEKKANVPITNLWIKAFKENGEYNFMHAARGC